MVSCVYKTVFKEPVVQFKIIQRQERKSNQGLLSYLDFQVKMLQFFSISGKEIQRGEEYLSHFIKMKTASGPVFTNILILRKRIFLRIRKFSYLRIFLF